MFDQLIQEHGLKESLLPCEDLVLALYNAAVAECERENVPIVGDSTDRRCLGHLHEVFTKTIARRSCASFALASTCATQASTNSGDPRTMGI